MQSQFRLRSVALIIIIIGSAVACPLPNIFLPVPDDDWNRQFLAVPIDLHTDRSTDLAVRKAIEARRTTADFGRIDMRDDVARPDTGLCRRAARHHVLNDDTTLCFESESAAKRSV